MPDQTDTNQMVALRTDDGAWYEVSSVVLERSLVRDAAEVAALKQPGDAIPEDDAEPLFVRLPVALEHYRVDERRAAEFSAALQAAGVQHDREGVGAGESSLGPLHPAADDDVGGFGPSGYFMRCDTSGPVVRCQIVKVSSDVFQPHPPLFPPRINVQRPL
jgi:hypothetical protein